MLTELREQMNPEISREQDYKAIGFSLKLYALGEVNAKTSPRPRISHMQSFTCKTEREREREREREI